MEKKEATEEQKKEINELLPIARWNLFVIVSQNFLALLIMIIFGTLALFLFKAPKDFRLAIDFLSFLLIVLNMDKELKEESYTLEKEVKKILNS